MNQLGRYELKEMIGEGAMSQVYKAYDPVLQRTLAIKVLKPEFSEDKERLSFFLNEVHVSGKLNHHNIVQIFDVGSVDEVPFIVMEFVDCQSLDDWMKEQTDISLDKVTDIMTQLASALEYAHSKGIIHRDIKPSNILIETNGRVRLTDFGVAYLHEQTELDQTQTIVGTPFYMSPEQLAGGVPDSRSDLYSMGVVFYQLVFGTLPFEASSIRNLVDLIQKSEVDLTASKCQKAIKKVIRRLLHKKPTFRYSSAGELVKQLNAVSVELSTKDPKWSEKITSTWRYTAIVATALSTLLVALLAFTLNDLSTSLSEVLGSYGRMLVQQTKEQVDEALLLGDDLALGITVERLSNNDEIEYLDVTDHEGLIKASKQPDMMGKVYRPPLDLVRVEQAQNVNIFQLKRDEFGNRIYHLTSPILFNGKEIGAVVMGLSANSVADVWTRTAWALGLFILIACIMITAIVYYLCRFFTRQFSQLGQALQSLYVGNYYTRLHVDRIDEIGYAKRQFNELAEQMETFILESDPDFEEETLPETEIEESEDRTVVIRKTGDVK